MPSRPSQSLTASFSITDANNEVVCPLRNQDGSSCRKRCIGEKRYRSMQEHIRRAHPEYYIAKLPATEESFHLMINTAPSDRPQSQQQNTNQPHTGETKNHDQHYRPKNPSAPGTPIRQMDEYQGGSAFPAAAALAQLHGTANHKSEATWDMDADWHSDNEGSRFRSTIELPPLQLNNNGVTSVPFASYEGDKHREPLPSILANSPPGRSTTLPPLLRSLGPNRPRKQSVSKRSHHRRKSKGATNEWVRRLGVDGADYLAAGSGDRKALSAEPSGNGNGKRWEDLIDAATSATEDIDEDRTPVPRSPISNYRASLPPPFQHTFQNYQASPLQQALTPPSYEQGLADAFPSVESGDSGDNFHMHAGGLSDSSPSFTQGPEIYCAACQSVSILKQSFACTECICGLCPRCVDVLMGEQGARRKCPRCGTVGGRFKPFQLDIR
ncbi:hypothetical protein DL546_000352 [Coniochaeta pulveracea]|uniref:RING zinc finger-like domain-containing protein n=1 Tax=Coniochaeta pulveracea TaxID=177199 RepID=A0A420Y337_9PEZI|nr:hypothetical protein DL546_000352 [Coniochaeta pulveracea]